ncbi:MAG: SpoIIE family protein phosphatase [Spirochaetes bacterium]|nr:SpoIIE family protein phosphatase [Spirochaetota bacterium]
MTKKITIFITILFHFSMFGQDIFWDREVSLQKGDLGKFQVLTNDQILVLLTTDVSEYSEQSKTYDIYFSVSSDNRQWFTKKLLIKDAYSHNEKGVDYSAAISKDNIFYLCYRKNTNHLVIIQVDADQNLESKIIAEVKSENIIYSPELYLQANNSLHLVYSENVPIIDSQGNRVNISTLNYRKILLSGEIVAEHQFAPNYRTPINPQFVYDQGTIYVFFQAKAVGSTLYHIMYAKTNDGTIWEEKVVIHSDQYNNQSPYALIKNKICYIVWEKNDDNYINHIYYIKLNIDTLSVITEERLLSSDISEAHSAFITLYSREDEVFELIFWYDNYKNNFQNYYIVNTNDIFTNPIMLTEKPGRTIYNQVLDYQDKPVLFFLQQNQTNELYYKQIDYFVDKPQIYVSKMPLSRKINRTDVEIAWQPVEDISGMREYRVLLTQEPGEKITRDIFPDFHTSRSKKFNQLKDGIWYAKIKAYDKAGNASEEAVYQFEVDTTPPNGPVFDPLELDEDGTLNTNSPIISWQADNESLKSYRVYQKLIFTSLNNEQNDQLIEQAKRQAGTSAFNRTTANSISLSELDNGILVVGVSGYDEAGNQSAISWQTYLLNDYIPRTYISYISPQTLPNGEQMFAILGRGFSVDGSVNTIYIDRDQKAPYDYVLNGNYFQVAHDRRINPLKSVEIEEGRYYIGVNHPVRGKAFYPNLLAFEQKWLFLDSGGMERPFYQISFITNELDATRVFIIIMAIIWIFILIILFFSAIRIGINKRRINYLLKELNQIRFQMSHLEYNIKKEVTMKIKMSLTFKYTITILLLVMMIVTSTSFTLGFIMLNNSKTNIANEIKERISIITSNFQTTINDVTTLEKGYTEYVDQTDIVAKLPNMAYALIHFNEDDSYIFSNGEEEEVLFQNTDFGLLTNEEKENILRDLVFTDQFKNDISPFKDEIIKNEFLIYPEFDTDNLKDYYLFVAPFYNELAEDSYAGEVVIAYSFVKTIEQLNQDAMNLIKITSLITLIAIAISALGAIILATSTIRPIKKMYSHVNVISETEDYEKLVGTEHEAISIKSSDEIAVLASSINSMTNKLIEKAKADKQLLLGKEIQKKFIPLEPHQTDYIDIYGFYNGAKGVSGDYFDYKKLDDDHYAFIICDVAGKAVPAALIMVQISTVFHAYFSNFKVSKRTLETVSVVNQINDTVAERGFQGRFAAILVVILNVKTGKALMTNAGYTQLLVYRKKKDACEWIKLNEESGAAGVFPTFMLPFPYKQEHMLVDKGDNIFLFTDGIEESRNGNILVNEQGEEYAEEFGLERVKATLEDTKVKIPERFINDLMKVEKEFRGELEQYDDLTVLAVMRK